MQQKFSSDARNWFIMRFEWRQNDKTAYKNAPKNKSTTKLGLENIPQLSLQWARGEF